MEEKETFMNLMTDFAFKRIFGSEKRKHLLIRFLNVLFAGEGLVVNDVKYHDKEVLPEDADGKRILYDIFCTVNGGRKHIIVEMQQVYQTLFENRTVYYVAKALSAQGRKGWNYDLSPVYAIFLVDFHFPHMSPKMLHDVRLADTRTHEVYSDVLRMIFVHLKEAKTEWDQCTTEYEKYLYLIKNMHRMSKESEAYRSGEYSELFKESEIKNLAADEAVAYSASQLKYQETLAAVDYAARQSYEQGMERGIKQGMERGMERGIKQGMERGIKQGIERGEENIICRLYESGMSVETIARALNMTETAVKNRLKQ